MCHSASSHWNNATPDSALIARIIPRTCGSGTGEIIDILSSVPNCLESFWASIELAFTSCHVRTAARELKRAVSTQIRGAGCFRDHLTWLHGHGYSREDSRQIRYVVEAFYNTEPTLAVLASLVLRWARSAECMPQLMRTECIGDGTDPAFRGAIQLKDQLPSDLIPPFRSIQAHRFHKALAMWPDYARKISQDRFHLADVEQFSAAFTTANRTLESLSNRIPVQRWKCAAGTRPEEFIQPALECVAASCEVMVVASAMRRAFIREESRARVARVTGGAR